MPTMNHNNRDKDTRKTGTEYALLNNSVYVPSCPYSHETVLILLKELELTWSNENYSRVDSTNNSTNAILCIGLGP